ncbi:RNA-binding protein NOB1 [Orchesella cincta]|uniref:RNA-binding protein NOB1 n=1 Tax=Orchesella cincta TaxID=48709 RepID=A0A1D2NH48_ORCCI|nr:RNA-binding protein NOB1 [Orchesella cincta]
MGKIEHLVVDANAFLKALPLQEMGENVYTVPDVVTEIRDSAVRQRLQVLPYDLQLKEPLPENIQFITKFSKATGDYPSLSAVDIRLMALAYQLTKEKLGLEAAERLLKKEPEVMKTETVLGSGVNNAEKKQDAECQKVVETVELKETCEEPQGNEAGHQEDDSGDENDEEPASEEDDDDDDDGWITPSNYKNKLKEMEGVGDVEESAEQIPVACITTDFAMQNVMLHIGMKVMSNSGMIIKNLRTYILRCYSCFRTTSIMTKTFCPSCGNKTLKKVSVSYKPDGTLVLHLSRRVNLTGRGKKYPLPPPHGGKHANNPILTEDQRIPQQRPSKMALQKNNPLGTDFIVDSSPFSVNDVYSRAAVLGINTKYSGTNYWDKKNPNEAKRKTGRKKKN